jgi:hypothetical protein
VFARERANGFYGTFTYALAKVVVCDVLPMRVLPPLFFGSIMYAQVGLNKVRYNNTVCIQQHCLYTTALSIYNNTVYIPTTTLSIYLQQHCLYTTGVCD